MKKTPDDKTLIDKQLDLMNKMNAKNAWELESQVKMVLTKLGVHDFKAKIGTLSGGQKKRVALAQALSPHVIFLFSMNQQTTWTMKP